jgi:adenine phosphoribosyltransferase
VRASIRDIPDFPTVGILFKDITPVLADARIMAEVIEAMCSPFDDGRVTHVVAIESRGFLFGTPVAMRLGAAFAPARKPGKLPWHTASEAYALEYRSDVLEMHVDALGEGARVLLVDDVLATGGTAMAASRLVKRLGGEVVGLTVLCELAFLGARERMRDYPIHAIVQY